jgi:hypothetical protein
MSGAHGRAFQINNRATARFGKRASEPISAAALGSEFEVGSVTASKITFDVPADSERALGVIFPRTLLPAAAPAQS